MDRYTITARFYPMVLFYLPVMFMFLIVGWDITKYVQYGISIGSAGMLTYLLANIGRDAGKSKEQKLWNSWGGAPTTQLFRWSNTIIDPYTKARNQQKMQLLFPVQHIMDANFEMTNPIEADHVYKAWTGYVINHTRDTNKYSLVFRENMSYGFRRNLWGLKPFALILIFMLAIGNYFYFGFLLSDWRLICFPFLFFVIEFLLLTLACFWVFIVTKKWISIPGFAYGERLHQAIDML